jgi:hypothetical protein
MLTLMASKQSTTEWLPSVTGLRHVPLLQPVEGEPEARRIAREKRLAAKQAAIDAARQEMRMREAASEEEKSQKVGSRAERMEFVKVRSAGAHSRVKQLRRTTSLKFLAANLLLWRSPKLTNQVACWCPQRVLIGTISTHQEATQP